MKTIKLTFFFLITCFLSGCGGSDDAPSLDAWVSVINVSPGHTNINVEIGSVIVPLAEFSFSTDYHPVSSGMISVTVTNLNDEVLLTKEVQLFRDIFHTLFVYLNQSNEFELLVMNSYNAEEREKGMTGIDPTGPVASTQLSVAHLSSAMPAVIDVYDLGALVGFSFVKSLTRSDNLSFGRGSSREELEIITGPLGAGFNALNPPKFAFWNANYEEFRSIPYTDLFRTNLRNHQTQLPEEPPVESEHEIWIDGISREALTGMTRGHVYMLFFYDDPSRGSGYHAKIIDLHEIPIVN